jgi:ABC-type uncharacterized transport system permease subunit
MPLKNGDGWIFLAIGLFGDINLLLTVSFKSLLFKNGSAILIEVSSSYDSTKTTYLYASKIPYATWSLIA